MSDDANIQTVTFELNGLSYYATRTYDNTGETLSCVYGRKLPSQYYDILETFQGKTRGMNNKQVSCVFGSMPTEMFHAIRALG